MGLEPTSGRVPPPVFKTGSSSGRMTSVDCHSTSSGGWNRTNGLLVQSQASLPAATTPDHVVFRTITSSAQVRGEGFEPPSPGSKPGSLPLADPRSYFEQECPAGVEPASPAWKAGTSAARPRARSKRKERESNPQGFIARLFSRQLPSPIGLPFRYPSCGGRNRTCDQWRLTGACLYQHRPHRNAESGVVGFEPTISCSRSRRNSRLSHTPDINESTQRESNPHFRHGKAAGCRYIMGAMNPDRIVKDQEHRVGLEPTSPHYGCGVLAAGRPVLMSVSGIRGTRTLTDLVKSQACCR